MTSSINEILEELIVQTSEKITNQILGGGKPTRESVEKDFRELVLPHKAKLLEAILACKPKKTVSEGNKDPLVNAVGVGFNQALDQWEQAIKEALK